MGSPVTAQSVCASMRKVAFWFVPEPRTSSWLYSFTSLPVVAFRVTVTLPSLKS
jgi:hypothetical protein